MNDERIGPGSLLLAFIAGAVTGAAVALLYAPATGEDTRDYLSRRAREGRERAEALAREGRERAEALAQKGRAIVDEQREHLASAIERGREAYQQARGDQEPV